jgi:hypothetical protein
VAPAFLLPPRDLCLDHARYVVVKVMMLEDLDKLRVRQRLYQDGLIVITRHAL